MCCQLHSCVCVYVCMHAYINDENIRNTWDIIYMCMWVYLSVCQSVSQSVSQSVCLSVSLSVCPYVHLLLYLINDEKKVMRSWKTSIKSFFKKQFSVLTLSLSPAFHLRFSIFLIYPRKLGDFTGRWATQWMDSIRK